jgi:hypothetical protein
LKKGNKVMNASECPGSVFTPMILLGIVSQKVIMMHIKKRKGCRECDLLALYKQRKDIQAGGLGMTLVVGHTVQPVTVVERGGPRQLEATLDLGLYKCRGTLESAIRVFLIDCQVVTLGVLTAFQHGRHDRDELRIEVATVVCVGHGLARSGLAGDRG